MIAAAAAPIGPAQDSAYMPTANNALATLSPSVRLGTTRSVVGT